VSDLPDVIELKTNTDGPRQFVAVPFLQWDGWYSGWVPLPLDGGCVLQFHRGDGQVVELEYARDDSKKISRRWVGPGWSLEAGKSTGEPDEDRWRVRPS
jgi:hypothetical protein